VRPAGTRAVLIDALGTLVALTPPAPLLIAGLRRTHAIELAPAAAERAFAREMSFYREHHHEARDEQALGELRSRCAQVLAAELPPVVRGALAQDELVQLLLASLHFSAQPDAERTLAALRARGMRVVVVSNWDCSLPTVLRKIGLEGLLDGVVSSAAVGARKPERRIFEVALELAGVGAPEAVHVGDSIENDVRGALTAGIGAVLLRRAAAATPGLPSGVPVIRTLDELASVIPRATRLGSLR
jgi:putative hydrolase of the HAD superfamily